MDRDRGFSGTALLVSDHDDMWRTTRFHRSVQHGCASKQSASRRQLPPPRPEDNLCDLCGDNGVGATLFQFLVDSPHRWMLSVLVLGKCVDLSEALWCIGHLPFAFISFGS